MPIYEYACGSCEHRFETIQKASEAPLRDCPSCGRSALKKLLSAPVFRLKGSGWYETDFKTSDKKNVAGDNGGESPSGDGTADTAKNDESATHEGSAQAATQEKRATDSADNNAAKKSSSPQKPAATAPDS